MKRLALNENTMQSLWLLFVLSIGLFSIEVLFGVLQASIVQFQPVPILLGWVGYSLLAGALLWISADLDQRFEIELNGIFGIAIGLLLGVKLGLSYSALTLLLIGFTAFLVVLVVRLMDRTSQLASPIAFLVLLVVSGDWMYFSLSSPSRTMIAGGIGAVLVVLFIGLVHRYGPTVRKQVWPFFRPVSWMAGLLLVISLCAWFYGGTSSVQSNFTGEIPEARLAGETSLKDMPNVILISIDTLRTDRIPPDADSNLNIPHLRRFYRDSVRYEDTISPSGWTVPTHASLFTGLLPIEHGAVLRKGSPIYPQVPSYTQVLRQLGYRTAAFTDGGYVHPSLGFGRGFEIYHTDYPPKRADQGFQPGLVATARRVVSGLRTAPGKPAGTRPDEYRYFWENTRAARRWIRSVKSDDNPFFLFLHSYEVHDYSRGYPRELHWLKENYPSLHSVVGRFSQKSSLERKSLTEGVKQRFSRRRRRVRDRPIDDILNRISVRNPDLWNLLKWWIATEPEDQWNRFLELSLERQKEALLKIFLAARRWGIPKSINLTTDYSSDDFFDRVQARYRLDDDTKRDLEDHMLRKLQAWRKLYDLKVMRVDETFGEFIDFLKNHGLYEDSLIVFVSDHGEGLSKDPLSLNHGFRDYVDGRAQLHESIIGVPAWIKLPGNRLAGTTCGGLNKLIRIFPTVLASLRIKLVNRNSFPAYSGNGPSKRDLCSEAGQEFVRGSAEELIQWNQSVPRFFVRTQDYKYIYQPALDVREYWDVQGGIEEEKRIPPGKVPPETRRRLRKHMQNFLQRFESLPDPYRRNFTSMDNEVEDKLRGLGYF